MRLHGNKLKIFKKKNNNLTIIIVSTLRLFIRLSWKFRFVHSGHQNQKKKKNVKKKTLRGGKGRINHQKWRIFPQTILLVAVVLVYNTLANKSNNNNINIKNWGTKTV